MLFAVFMSLGLACGSVFIIDKSFQTGSQEQSESQKENDEEITATASGYWLDYANTNRPSGSGTSSDPYRIGSATTLASFAFMVNNNYKNSDSGLLYRDAYVKLTADIDLSAHYWTPIGSGAYSTTEGWWIFSSTTWHPYYYSGVFDGDGHTISGMQIRIDGADGFTSKYVSGDTYSYGDESVNFTFNNVVTAGLFGFTLDATIRNFTMKSGSINIYGGSSSKSLWGHVGAVVGLLSGGRISNVKNEGVYLYYTQNSGNSYTATSSLSVGGVVGTAIDTATISSCFNSAGISIYFYATSLFNELFVGGVVGITTYDVSSCKCSGNIYLDARNSGKIAATGASFGGIIGMVRSTRGNMWCYDNIHSGDIDYDIGPGSLINSVGGIIGNLLNLSGSTYKVYNCINYGNIEVTNIYNTFVGGIVAVNQSEKIEMYYCSNFGDLDLTLNSDSCTESGYGGILGASSTSGTYIYTSANYGDINVSSSKSIRNIGGIAGWIIDAGLVTGCINHGVVSGGSNSNSVGGIVGQTGKEEKAGSWFFNVGHEDAKTNVYVVNCVNYSRVSGSANYAQIVGFINGSDRVIKCYGNSSYTAGSDSSAGGCSSGTTKSYSSLMSFSFYSTGSSYWTTGTYAGYSAVKFNVLTNYSTSNGYWLMSPLVYNYYSSTEQSLKGMNKNYPNIIVPMNCVARAGFDIEWNKKNEKYISSFSDDIASIKYYVYDPNVSTFPKLVEKTITSSSNNLPYLDGADYTVSYRYKNLFWVEYNPSHFSLSKFSIKYDEYQQSQSYTTETGNNGNRKIYVKFLNELYTVSKVYFKFSFSSIAQSVNIDTYTYKSYDTTKELDSDNSKGGSSENLTNVYYLDEINIKGNPNLGYAVNQITSNNQVVYFNFRQSKTGNFLGQDGIELDSDEINSVVVGNVSYSFDYSFQDIGVYFVPIVYKVTIVSSWTGNDYFSPVISMRGGCSAVNDYLTLGENNLDINLGYKYSIYIENNNSSTNNCVKDNVECDYQNKKIILSPDELINGLNNLENPLEKTEFVVHVTRIEIEYTIKINNMINSYTAKDQYVKVDSNNFKSLVFGNISSDVYKDLFGVDMPEFVNKFAYINDDTFSVGDRYKLNYDDLKGSFTNARISFENSSSLPVNMLKNENDFDSLLKDYISFAFSGSSGPMQSTEINIYVYSILNSYSFNGKLNIDGENTNTKDVTISMHTKENFVNSENKKQLDFYDTNSISYFSPVTLSIDEIPYGYKFIGWYVKIDILDEDCLLSLNEQYTFINNLLIDDMGNIEIIAKFITYTKADDNYTLNPNKKVYSISSADDLVWLSKEVGEGNTFEGITINQTANIDMSGIIFNSIGSVETPFKGIYNGNNYLIENINFGNHNINYRGLFGYVENATIKNVTIKNDSINIVGYSYVGSLIGSAKNSTIENINNLSNLQINEVKYYSIYQKEIEVYLNSDGETLSSFVYQQYIGGIVGKAENCDFVACANQGQMSIAENCEYVGGLIGYADSGTVINQSFNSKSVSSSSSDNVNNLANGSALVSDCYYVNSGSYVVVNGTQTGTTEKFNGVYNANNKTNLDSSIWIEVNGNLALKIFYWA